MPRDLEVEVSCRTSREDRLLEDLSPDCTDCDKGLFESDRHGFAGVVRAGLLLEAGVAKTIVWAVLVIARAILGEEFESLFTDVAKDRPSPAAPDDSIAIDRNELSAGRALNSGKIGNSVEVMTIEKGIDRWTLFNDIPRSGFGYRPGLFR